MANQNDLLHLVKKPVPLFISLGDPPPEMPQIPAFFRMLFQRQLPSPLPLKSENKKSKAVSTALPSSAFPSPLCAKPYRWISQPPGAGSPSFSFTIPHPRKRFFPFLKKVFLSVLRPSFSRPSPAYPRPPFLSGGIVEQGYWRKSCGSNGNPPLLFDCKPGGGVRFSPFSAYIIAYNARDLSILPALGFFPPGLARPSGIWTAFLRNPIENALGFSLKYFPWVTDPPGNLFSSPSGVPFGCRRYPRLSAVIRCYLSLPVVWKVTGVKRAGYYLFSSYFVIRYRAGNQRGRTRAK